MVKKNAVISVGLDSRPTGPAIGEAVVKTLLSMGIEVRYHFIISAPEIMAYVKNTEDSDGFIYISASHNPSGYNGIKFGPSTGAVLGGKDSADIINNYKSFILESSPVETLNSLTENLDKDLLEKTYLDHEKWKDESYKTYLDFNKDIFSFGGRYKSDKSRINIGITADLNGSARCLSIDKEFLILWGLNHTFLMISRQL